MKEELEQKLLDFVTNGCDSFTIAEFLKKDEFDVKGILVDFENKWNDVKVDAEGATDEQDHILNSILNYAVSELMAL